MAPCTEVDKLPSDSPTVSLLASHHDSAEERTDTPSLPAHYEDKAPVPVVERKTSLVSEVSSKRFSRVSSWTWITILGQFLVLAVALSFFVLIQFSQTPMPQRMAEWAKDSPRGLAYVVTGMATLFSAVSSFFFSKGLVLFITSRSDRSTSVLSFLTMSHLARRTAFFSARSLGWTLLSIMTLVLLNSLTASFTTLLTPTPLMIHVLISGKEFALDSEPYLQAVNNNASDAFLPMMTPAMISANKRVLAAIGPLSLTSAYTTASRHIGYPGVVNYLGSTLNSSTGGIVPSIPEDLQVLQYQSASSSFANYSSLKPRFKFDDPHFKPSRVLPYNYTTLQQGFTANVVCELLQPAESAPQSAPSIVSELVQNLTLPDNTTTQFWRFLYQCPIGPLQNRTKLRHPKGSIVVDGTCPNQDLLGNQVPGSQLLIMAGYGPLYSVLTPRVCEFTPYFTLSEVRYSTKVNVSRIVTRNRITARSQPLAQLIFDQVLKAIHQYAGDKRDKIGDDLYSLYGITWDINAQNDELLNGILANYLLGLLETSATLIKTPPISVGDHLLAASSEGLSDQLTRDFNGTWSYETLGWHKAKDSLSSTAISLLSILLVTLTSSGLALYSLISLKRSHRHMEEPFDPNDLVVLLKAGRDGAVVDTLDLQDAPAGRTTPKRNVAIRLLRNDSQWELRPVVEEF